MARLALRFLGLFALAVAVTACSGVAVLNLVTSRAGFETIRGVRYMPGERGTFDFYVPENATATTPVVVFIYGGSWDSGSKGTYPFVGQSLASEGFIVAIPDYRIYPEVIFPAFVEDGARAFASIEKLVQGGGQGVPAGRHPMLLMGHSAGAHIAALLAFDEHYLRDAGTSAKALSGFVGLSGPYDFLPLTEERYKRIFPPRMRDASQPINFVSGGEPPALLIAGLADTTVDPKNTRSMARRIRAAGGSVQEKLYPGIDHVGTISSFATALPLGNPDIRATVVRFLKAHAR